MNSNSEISSMIDIYLVENTYLLFDKAQSIKLRDQLRLCPRLIGSYSNLASKTQTSIASIPAQLSHEEVCILIDGELRKTSSSIRIRLLESSKFDKMTFDNMNSFMRFEKEYKEYLNRFVDKQNENFRIVRREQLLSMKEKIIDGKKRKLKSQLEKVLQKLFSNPNDERLETEKQQLEFELGSLEQNFNLELEKCQISDQTQKPLLQIGHESLNTEIFVHTPDFYLKSLFFDLNQISLDDFYLRNKNTTCETCRYKVFKHLWSCGFYLTNGAKFGGDFLVYQGDPSKFHSQFILVCLEREEDYLKLSLKQLITYARMATSVKKTFLLALCSTNKTDREIFSIQLNGEESSFLYFISLNWSHI
jgi:tRNA-splicing endonuclease subunit Sen34